MTMDRSKYQRYRILKPGAIGLDRWSTVVDCTIRNLSGRGAFLALPGSVDLPDGFELLIKPDGLIHSCRVIWRNDEGIGVEFVSRKESIPASKARESKSAELRNGLTGSAAIADSGTTPVQR